jgi:hypothetical protein
MSQYQPSSCSYGHTDREKSSHAHMVIPTEKRAPIPSQKPNPAPHQISSVVDTWDACANYSTTTANARDACADFPTSTVNDNSGCLNPS